MATGMKKIIDLVKKTGDNCVVLDSNGDPAFVVLGLSDYEKLVAGAANHLGGLTEDELLEKINRDIASWKATQTDQLDNWQSLESAIKQARSRIIESQDLVGPTGKAAEDKYYFEPIEE